MSITQDALGVPSIKSVSLRENETVGVAYCEETGIEFDVRRENYFRWYVSDDEGRKYSGITLPAALRRAISANRKGSA